MCANCEIGNEGLHDYNICGCDECDNIYCWNCGKFIMGKEFNMNCLDTKNALNIWEKYIEKCKTHHRKCGKNGKQYLQKDTYECNKCKNKDKWI